MIERRPALGKGLSALIPDTPEPPRQGAFEVDIDLLAPSDQQPRQMLDDDRLGGLAESIRANGVIQPILARRTGGTYRIIAGERRWRAAQRAGLLRVPHRDPRCPRGVGTAVTGTRARRESPARKSQPSGRGTRLPASGRRLRPHPGADRRGRWQGPHVGHQLSAPAAAARRSPRRPCLRRPLDGACAGAPGAAGCLLPASGRPGRHFQIAVSSRHRSAREKAHRRSARPAPRARPSTPGCPHPRGRGPHALLPWNEKCASSGGTVRESEPSSQRCLVASQNDPTLGAQSRSTSVRNRSCIACSSALRRRSHPDPSEN